LRDVADNTRAIVGRAEIGAGVRVAIRRDTLQLYAIQLKGPTKPYHRLTQRVNAQFRARMV
jgi:hypothetical protein